MNAEITRPGRGDFTLSGFVAAAVVALALVCAAYWLSLQQSRAAGWVSHTQEVLASIARTRAALVDIQNGHRGFTISGREEDLEPYRAGRAAISSETARLRALIADNPSQQQHLADLEAALGPRLASAGLPDQEMARLRQALQSLEGEEEQLLRRGLADHDRRVQWFWTGMTALVAGLFAVLAVLYLQVRRRRAAQDALLVEMRERTRLDGELQRLNRSLETQVRERTAALSDANSGLLDAKLRLHELSSQLIAGQEEERRHIARELHDDTGQSLSVIRMHLSDLQRGGAGAMARLPDCIAIVDAAIARIRAMALSLRPTMLDDLGLADALQWALEHRAKAAGWRTALQAQELPAALPADVQTACFRIAQEALANAARHAGATEVTLSLRMLGSDLELCVHDNGAGFDLERYRSPQERKLHFGLMTMTERAALVGGILTIVTAPGSGTHIRASFPILVESVLDA